MKRHTPITICDLAERLRVTHSTVSRALAPGPGRAHMRPATRDRIVRLARRLGYRPNAIARNLVCRRSYSIGVIIRHFNDPFIGNLIQDIHVRLTRRKYLGMFFSARNPVEFDQALDSLLSRQVEGLISVSLRREEAARVRNLDMPIVYYGDIGRRCSRVGVDDVRGAMLAMSHLIECGHRKIGFIGQTKEWNRRYRGFQRMSRRHGLPCAAPWIAGVDTAQLEASVDGVFREGYRLMRQLLALRNRPTAVICNNDVMALGALRSVLAAGLTVPGDMALVGFDNLREGEYAAVPLTTVDPHLDQIAARLTETVIQRVENRESDLDPVRIRIEPSLVVRESTVGRLKKGAMGAGTSPGE